MGFPGWAVSPVRVVMMLVVGMRVFVLQRLMRMQVLVTLGEMQVEASGHRGVQSRTA